MPGWQIGRHLCTDPQQDGHINVHGTPGDTPTPGQQTAEDQPAEAARKTEERRRVRQRNTAWRAATGTRTAHLRALLGRKAPPAGAVKLVVEAMARGETQPQMSSFGHQTACELLGLAGNGAGAGHRDLLLAELDRASEKRAQVIALAMVLGAAEHGARDVHTWQSAENQYWASCGIPQAARYLTWLAKHTGYPLSDIEAEVAAHATGQAATGSSEPAGEAGLARPSRVTTAIRSPACARARASPSGTAPARHRPRHPSKPANSGNRCPVPSDVRQRQAGVLLGPQPVAHCCTAGFASPSATRRSVVSCSSSLLL